MKKSIKSAANTGFSADRCQLHLPRDRGSWCLSLAPASSSEARSTPARGQAAVAPEEYSKASTALSPRSSLPFYINSDQRPRFFLEKAGTGMGAGAQLSGGGQRQEWEGLCGQHSKGC